MPELISNNWRQTCNRRAPSPSMNRGKTYSVRSSLRAKSCSPFPNQRGSWHFSLVRRCTVGLLVSVNVGLPADVEWQGKLVHTAVWKRPVAGRVMARRLNLDGDGQGDVAGHGGEHRAVMVYQLDSYRYWEVHLQRHDFEYGQSGENLTVDGLADDEGGIGGRYRIGGALFEVTQPRVTCYRVGIRMNNPAMPA